MTIFAKTVSRPEPLSTSDQDTILPVSNVHELSYLCHKHTYDHLHTRQSEDLLQPSNSSTDLEISQAFKKSNLLNHNVNRIFIFHFQLSVSLVVILHTCSGV
jgi:hypothetical protein